MSRPVNIDVGKRRAILALIFAAMTCAAMSRADICLDAEGRPSAIGFPLSVWLRMTLTIESCREFGAAQERPAPSSIDQFRNRARELIHWETCKLLRRLCYFDEPMRVPYATMDADHRFNPLAYIHTHPGEFADILPLLERIDPRLHPYRMPMNYETHEAYTQLLAAVRNPHPAPEETPEAPRPPPPPSFRRLVIKDPDAFLRDAEKAITRSPSVDDRVNAIKGLAAIDRPDLGEKICQLAIRALLDPDPRRQAEMAARQLLGRHSLTAVPLLFQQGIADAYILLTACELAGECSIFGRAFLPALTEVALHHEDPPLRAAAIKALEDIGPLDDAGRAVLATALKDTDPAVRTAAARALIVQGRISGTDPIIDALIKNAPPINTSVGQVFQQHLSRGVD
jgi:hypothetical protein